jgi:hypothetical protein
MTYLLLDHSLEYATLSIFLSVLSTLSSASYALNSNRQPLATCSIDTMLSPKIISGTGMLSDLDISSIGCDFEIGSLRALILNPFWVCDNVEASVWSGEGYGSDIGPLNDIVAD